METNNSKIKMNLTMIGILAKVIIPTYPSIKRIKILIEIEIKVKLKKILSNKIHNDINRIKIKQKKKLRHIKN